MTEAYSPAKIQILAGNPALFLLLSKKEEKGGRAFFVGQKGNRASSGTPYRDAASDEGVTPCESRAQSPRARSTCSTMSRTAPSPPRNSET